MWSGTVSSYPGSILTQRGHLPQGEQLGSVCPQDAQALFPAIIKVGIGMPTLQMEKADTQKGLTTHTGLAWDLIQVCLAPKPVLNTH